MKRLQERVRKLFPARCTGRIHRLTGAIAESRGLFAPVGGLCEIRRRDGPPLKAEVVGFRGRHALVATFGDTRGVAAGDRIEYSNKSTALRVGPGLIGRVVDAEGVPIDGGGPVRPAGVEVPLHRTAGNPLRRHAVDQPLATGVRVVDALSTVGRGQRLGIFAGSGVGKSQLLGMLARNAEAGVVVLALIGERSREVREFVEREFGDTVLRRAVVVAATAEEPPLKRLQAAYAATAIAEYFRDRGRHVLLLLDSLTRLAMGQRELGLLLGEPPAARGYPPSVFVLLPRLLERAGPGTHGSITGFYATLAEADDKNDPVVDCARAALDGHLWLSRELAERGHYPAVDPLASVSRVQANLVSPTHGRAVRLLREALARYRDAEDLIRVGAYVEGVDPLTDAVVRGMPAIRRFLCQARDEPASFEATLSEVEELAGDLERAVKTNRKGILL